MTPLGELSLWAALTLAAWCALLTLLGGALRRPDLAASGARAATVTPLFVAVAASALASALLRGDFSLAYVASVTSANLPGAFRAAALWAGPAGALLVFALALSVCAAVVARADAVDAEAGGPRRSVALATLGVLLTAALGILAVKLPPFAALEWAPADGTPGAPPVPSVAAAVATPLILAGAAATAVPFSLALSALVCRQAAGQDFRADGVRGWALAAWLLLTMGLGLAVRGPAAAPVEHALVDGGALALWLGVTALLHAVGTAAGTPAGGARWSAWLAISTFLLAPVVVRRLAGGGDWGWTYPVLAAALGAIAAAAIVWRARGPRAATPDDSTLPVRLARTATYVIAAGAGSVLLGAGLRAALGPDAGAAAGDTAIRRLALPLAALALAMIGVGTGARAEAAWRLVGVPGLAAVLGAGAMAALGVRSVAALAAGAIAAFAAAGAVRDLARAGRARDLRPAGAAAAHVGVAMLALGFAGPPLRREYEATLRTGQSLAGRDPWGREWRFTSDGLSSARRENYVATVVSLSAFRGGRRQALLTGEQRQYLDVRERPVSVPVAVAGVAASPWQDVRLTLVDAEGEDEAHVRITFAPLARLVWYGALTMLAGGLLSLLSPPSAAAPRRAAGGPAA